MSIHCQGGDRNTEHTGIAQVANSVDSILPATDRARWLDRVLRSGEVSRVGQHIALVIYLLAEEQGSTEITVRQLARITGWSVGAVCQHLDEIHLFIRYEAGKGRTRSRATLLTAITETVEKIRSVQQVNASVQEVNAKGASVHVVDVQEVNTSRSVQEVNAKASVAYHHVNTKPDLGGTIGGEPRTTVENQGGFARERALTREGEPALARLNEAGGFEGHAFDLAPSLYRDICGSYPFLEFPGDLITADAILAGEFERTGEMDVSRRLNRLATYLGAMNRKTAALTKAVMNPASKVSKNDDNCWWDDDRLQVANGFRADLLAHVGNSDSRLRITLDKAAGKIPEGLRGAALRKAVRAEFLRQAEFDQRDERKVAAIEGRGKPVAFKMAPAPKRPVNYDPADDPEILDYIRSLPGGEKL